MFSTDGGKPLFLPLILPTKTPNPVNLGDDNLTFSRHGSSGNNQVGDLELMTTRPSTVTTSLARKSCAPNYCHWRRCHLQTCPTLATIGSSITGSHQCWRRRCQVGMFRHKEREKKFQGKSLYIYASLMRKTASIECASSLEFQKCDRKVKSEDAIN